MDVKSWIGGARLATGMLVVQAIAAGMQLLSRVILTQGMFVFALMVYRNIVAAISVAPFALFRHDRGNQMRITLSAFFWLFMAALTGISMASGFFYYGLRDTTATYATNFLNLIPTITFLFSIILRIEKLGLNTKLGKLKVCGASLCLAGALTSALYEGKVIQFISRRRLHVISNLKTKHNWSRGTIFLFGSCVSYVLWFILQAKLVKVFSHRYWATMLTCIIASLQNTVIGLCIDTNKSSWRLGWNLQLVTIFYSGVLATSVTFCLVSWVVAKRGPTYPSMFNPLSLIFVAISEAFFLGEEITIESLLGMVLIIVGLYTFLWGKNLELKIAAAAPQMKENVDNEAAEVLSDQPVGMQLTSLLVPADSLTNTASNLACST